MRRAGLVLLLLVCVASMCLADARTVVVMLGVTPVPVVVHSGPEGAELNDRVVFIALHDNENVGVEAARGIVAERGGTLVELRHSGKRYISFQLKPGGRWYRVDPNRVFTDLGRRIDEGAENFGQNRAAVAAVRAFAEELLSDLVLGDGKTQAIVAVHNNGGLTLEDEALRPCLRDWVPMASESTEFMLVTEDWLYQALAPTGYDIGLVDRELLEDNKGKASPTDGLLLNDGSLSVYCSIVHRIPYVNVEAYNDPAMIEPQREMLNVAVDRLLEGLPEPSTPSPSPTPSPAPQEPSPPPSASPSPSESPSPTASPSPNETPSP